MKRIIVGAGNAFSVYGFNLWYGNPHLLARYSTKLEEIKYADFIDDHNPLFILLVTHDKIHHRTVFRILRLREPNTQVDTQLLNSESADSPNGAVPEDHPQELLHGTRGIRELLAGKASHSSVGVMGRDSVALGLRKASMMKDSVISEPS